MIKALSLQLELLGASFRLAARCKHHEKQQFFEQSV